MSMATTLKQPTQVRQHSLIAAALALAAERSPAEVTTAQLAQAIGVSQGAVFRHFESKDAIWLAVLEDTSERLQTRLRTAAQSRSDALAALQALFETHVAFVIEHPGLPRLVFQELQRPDETPLKARVAQLMQAYRQLLHELLTRAQAQGQLLPGTDLQAAVVLYMGAIQGLVIQSLLTGSMDAMRERAPGVFALYLAGLTGQPTPAATPLLSPTLGR